jgi:hypothetical protein
MPMSAAATTPTMYCHGCGYVLDGLRENRCPECGEGFDPSNPKTFCGQPPLHPVKVLLLKPIGWPTFLLTVTASLMWLLGDSPPPSRSPWVPLAFLLWSAIAIWWSVRLLVILVVWLFNLKHRYRPVRHIWRWLVPPALLALSVAGEKYDVKFQIWFFVSRPAMERLVQRGLQLPPGSTLPDQAVGFFDANGIHVHGGKGLTFCYTRPRSDMPGSDLGFLYWPGEVQPKLLKDLFNFSGCEHYSGNWYTWWRPDW